jgi:hypothetical protein
MFQRAVRSGLRAAGAAAFTGGAVTLAGSASRPLSLKYVLFLYSFFIPNARVIKDFNINYLPILFLFVGPMQQHLVAVKTRRLATVSRPSPSPTASSS